MMAIASLATTNSTGSVPFFSASCTSSSFIFREALARSIVPLIRDAIPVPEPPPLTEMLTSGLTWYCSAHASARLTMVSDPEFMIAWEAEGWLFASLWEQPDRMKIIINKGKTAWILHLPNYIFLS